MSVTMSVTTAVFLDGPRAGEVIAVREGDHLGVAVAPPMRHIYDARELLDIRDVVTVLDFCVVPLNTSTRLPFDAVATQDRDVRTPADALRALAAAFTREAKELARIRAHLNYRYVKDER